MKAKKLNPHDPALTEKEREALQAAREYEGALRVLDMFKIENSAIFQNYAQLLDEVEQKRQVADKLLRSLNASYGPWELFSEQRSYDAQALYNLVGEQRFLELGGRISQQTVYEIDKEKAEIAINAKKIPTEAVDSVRKITPKYRSPKPQS